MSFPDINATPLRYWAATGYSEENLLAFCKDLDDSRLIALITFEPGSPAKIAISTKTWEVQAGHYGSICAFFSDVSLDSVGAELSGQIVVWLDDGMHNYEYHKFRSVPLFAFGRSIYDAHTLLMPDPAFMEEMGFVEVLKKQRAFEATIPFEMRKSSLFWRGAASGLSFDPIKWRMSQRGKLTLKSKSLNNTEIIDASFSKIPKWDDETCESIKRETTIAPFAPFEDFLKYRYLIDADGISCAWISLFRKLASQSVTVKMQSENQQWYYDQLKPWHNYVPLRADAEDVEDIHQWLCSHPKECREIIANANALIESLSYADEVRKMAQLIQRVLGFRKYA